ncbi:MAG: phage portal protein, partial [Mogibacterium sp.]|nr:phage portal protein [Mogibacterium sp.]
LKDAWARLFSSESEENVVILNNGLDFQEASETSTDMQINETVGTITKQICEIFNVPPAMLNREIGSASEEDRLVFIQYCITPILSAVENALNRDLLLESEKGKLKWAADTSEFTKADVLKRYQAYEIASKNGFMQIDEVRFKENLEPLGLDFVKLGLQDVLYYPEKDGMTFVPNMNAVGGIKLAMEDREEAKKQKEAELKMQAEGNIDDIAKKI